MIFSILRILLILLLAFLLRFHNFNWDTNFHLHPDERFLTMVGGALKIPANPLDYFNPQISTLNPANVGYGFYVYGTFPLFINKLVATYTDSDDYNNFNLQGRAFSILCDLLVIILIYKSTELLAKKAKIDPSIKYWAGFFYSIAVLPIQLSHFFTSDLFLNLFVFASFYFALRYFYSKNLQDIVISAFFFGLAMASKISAVYILPLIFFLICFKYLAGAVKYFKRLNQKAFSSIKLLAIVLILYIGVVYIVVRFADPYLFQTSNFFDPTPNKTFIESIRALKSYEGKDIWYPPAIQWISKDSFFFSAKNLVFFGVGISYFIFVAIGMYSILVKFRKIEILFMLLWILIFFTYQSLQFVKAMRYLIIIYPFLAILAGIGYFYFTRKFNLWLKLLIIALFLVWPLAFSSIYINKNSRIAASEWIHQNLPDGSINLTEYWDDPLPLTVKNSSKVFRTESLSVFDQDTKEKWDKMNPLLTMGDYYILSSNRGWGSIMSVPQKYPLMAKFYEDLFAGKTQYKKIKEFTSYPSLRYLGIPLDFPDDGSDESFTVYDHPKVLIFQNINKKTK